MDGRTKIHICLNPVHTSVTRMATLETEEKEFSDEELEEIIDMQAPKELVKQFESMVKERPLLVSGLIFAFGLLLGAGLSRRRRSR